MSTQTQPAFDQVEVLKNVVLFTLSGVHLWTGRRRLSADDFEAGTNLPPETLASLGSKKIYDPQHLKIFETLKRRAHDTCANHGTKFLSGYAVPKAKASDVARQLQRISDEFDVEKARFLRDYDANIHSWLQANQAWAHILRKAVTPKSDVDAQLRFGFEACAVTPTEDKDLDSTLNQAVGSLSGNLFADVAQLARETIDQSLIGREKVTRKFLSPIKRIRNKLDGLSFIDPLVAPVVTHIDAVLQGIAQVGPIEGRDLSALSGLLYLIANPDRMREHGLRVLTGGTEAEEGGVIDGGDAETEESASALVEQSPPTETAADDGQRHAPAEVQPTPSMTPATGGVLPFHGELDVVFRPLSTPTIRVKQTELPGVQTQAEANIAKCKEILERSPANRRLAPISF